MCAAKQAGVTDGILLSENRRGTRINESPFLVFRVIPLGYWPDFNLESVFLMKNKFVMKNVSDFVKIVESGVDPRQENLVTLIAGNLVINCKINKTRRTEINQRPELSQRASFPFGGVVDCLQSAFSLKIRLVLILSSAIANHEVFIPIRD